MSIAHRILGNTFAQIAGKVITACIALLTVNILSDYFSTSQFGDYATVYSYLALFGAIADMGIYTLVLREMSKAKSDPSRLYGTGTALRIVITFIAMCFAVLGAFAIPKYMGTNIPNGVIIAAIGTFFILMSGTVSVVLQYALKMKYYQYSMVAGKILIFLGVLLVTQYFYPANNQTTGIQIYGDAPFYWILTIGTIGAFLIMLFTFFCSQKQLPLSLSFEKNEMKQMLSQAVPFGLSMILTTFYFQMGMLFLGWLLPRSQNDVCMAEYCGDIESGKYVIALRMMEVLLYFPVFFMTSLLPLMTQSIEEKSKNTSKVFSYGFLFLFTLGLPMSVGGYFLSSTMASILGDEKLLTVGQNYGSDTAFSLLAIALFFAFCNYFASYALIALNQQKTVLIINSVMVCVGIVSNILLIPEYGLIGAGITTIICEVVLFTMMYGFLQKISPFHLPWKQIAVVTMATIFMGVFLMYVSPYLHSEYGKYISLLGSFIGSIAIFGGVIWKFGFVTDEMKSVIAR